MTPPLPAPEDRAFRTIAVFGDGNTGLSAAAAFARALPWARVSIVATPTDPASLADRSPGILPATARLDAALDLSEETLTRHAGAMPRVGWRLERWTAGPAWFHGYGEIGQTIDGAPFHQLWARAAREGSKVEPFHRYAPALALAEAGRFVHPDDHLRSPLSAFDYALRISPAARRAALRGVTQAAGISHLPAGIVATVERQSDGRVAAVQLADGRRIEADLFVDCTGPAAAILSVLDPGFEDWSAMLPVDRVLLAERIEPDVAAEPVDTATATSVGWRWRVPYGGRASVGLAFASPLAGESRARRVLASETGVGDAELVAIRPGRRARSWINNVVAFGDAAVAFDPLGWTLPQLARAAIERAVALMPGRACHPLELAEINRLTALEQDSACDFVALHYAAAQGRGGALRLGRPPVLPSTLAATLEHYRARGRLPQWPEAMFGDDATVGLLCGMGVLPAMTDPVADAVPSARAAAAMAAIAARNAGPAGRLPPYPDYLARMRRALAATAPA